MFNDLPAGCKSQIAQQHTNSLPKVGSLDSKLGCLQQREQSDRQGWSLVSTASVKVVERKFMLQVLPAEAVNPCVY